MALNVDRGRGIWLKLWLSDLQIYHDVANLPKIPNGRVASSVRSQSTNDSERGSKKDVVPVV